MMTLNYLVLFAILTLSTCVPVFFEEPQPKNAENLESFPEVLQGTYIDADGNEYKIQENSSDLNNYVSLFDSSMDTLSDKRILRKFEDVFIYNEYNVHDFDKWSVYVLTFPNDSILKVSYIPSDNDEIILKLKTIAQTKEMIGEENLVYAYIINPSVKELKAIKKAGLFASSYKFKKK